MTQRVYDIELPYYVSSFFIGMAISKLEDAGDWDGLPVELKSRFKNAQASWKGIELSQDDLDSISDDLWADIAVHLGVTWHNA